jgi:hypothetical protein
MADRDGGKTTDEGSTRRQFVRTTVAGAVGVTVGYQASRGDENAPKAPSGAPFTERTFAAMPTRNLGKTGYRRRCASGARSAPSFPSWGGLTVELRDRTLRAEPKRRDLTDPAVSSHHAKRPGSDLPGRFLSRG